MNRIALAVALATMIAATPAFAAPTVCWDDPVVLGQCHNPAPELAPNYTPDTANGIAYTTTADLGGGHTMTYIYYVHGQVVGVIDGETVSIWITKNGHLVKTYQR